MELQESADGARQALARQADDLAQARAERDGLAGERAQLQGALREARAEREALHVHLVAVTAEIQAMRGSRGWRALEAWGRLKRLLRHIARNARQIVARPSASPGADDNPPRAGAPPAA
jgi:hypothetical protein